MKKISEINVNINLVTLLLIGVILLLLIVFGWNIYINNVNKLEDKIETEVKLRDALLDKVIYYQNKEKEWVAEKLTIQTSIKNLENINGKLSSNQKELLNRISEINKSNNIIAAALIQTQVKIDSLIHKGSTTVDTLTKKITFSDSYKEENKEVYYSFVVKNILPSPITAKPVLLIDSLHFPNKQFIEFHWKNDKKKGYPVSFSISNSNGYFKTIDVDSYVIPQISKEKLNPNGWQKIGNFFIRNGNTLMWIGIGGIIGATTVLLITK